MLNNMDKIKIYFFFAIALFICFLPSCKQEKAVLDRKSLLNHYTLPEDSLKRMAVAFIIDNIDTHCSEIPIFTNRDTGKETPFDLSLIENDSVLRQTIERFNLTPSFKVVSDTTLVCNAFLTKDIDLAFQLWNKYPWANQVPFEIFLNYLLPYKIYGEEPSDWRSFFVQKYKESVRNLLINSETDAILASTNEIYYQFIVSDVGQWFRYEANPVRLTQRPGLHELMALRTGECYGWAYLNVMILRSLGIPATIDNIPMWGRKNAGHASEVFWDNQQQRFRTASGREFQFPAKVFRYTFKVQNGWTNSILPTIKQNLFLLDFLKHNHWKDVTHEHTPTATIEYEWEFTTDFAYICVLNYGQWQPIYWGKVENGKVHFENMGTDMLYRVAIPKGNSFEIISPIFHLDEVGNKTFFNPNQNEKINLQLSKRNTGALSWVEVDKNYSLFYYDENDDWTLFGTQKCETDSLIVFDGAPSNTLYWLWDISQDRRLERIFMYEDDKQVFY
jgi:hypothetical protein